MAPDPVAGDREFSTSQPAERVPDGSGGLDAYLASLNARFDELAEKIDGSAREIIGRTREAFREPPDAEIIPFSPGTDATTDRAGRASGVVRTPFHHPHPAPHRDGAPRRPQPDHQAGVEAPPQTRAAPTLRPPASPERYAAPPMRPPAHPDPYTPPPAVTPPVAAPPVREKPQRRRRRSARSRPRWRRPLKIVAMVVAGLTITAGAFLAGNWLLAPAGPGEDPAAAATTVPSSVASTTTIPADPLALARDAVAAAGVAGIDIRLDGDAAVLTGTVADEADREAAARAVLAVPGVVRLDNRIAVVEPAPEVPPDPIEVQYAAQAALAASGLGHLTVTVEDGTAVLSGVIPLDALAGGYFAYTEPVRESLLAIDGIDTVSSRLQLRGDEASLRRELAELIDVNPIIFPSGRAEIDEQSAATLNEAARIIISHPGLRVLVAGHTDTSGNAAVNEALAAQRGAAVLGYLVGRGVPVTRLQVVSYGELFPESDAPAALNRRIEFEVAP